MDFAAIFTEHGPYIGVISILIAGYGPVWTLLRNRDQTILTKDLAHAKALAEKDRQHAAALIELQNARVEDMREMTRALAGNECLLEAVETNEEKLGHHINRLERLLEPRRGR